MTRSGVGLASAGLVVGAAGALMVLLVLLAGASPATALRALAEGSVGSWSAFGETLARTTAIAFTALAAALAFRAGALNIGVEGQLLMGAAAAAAVGPALASTPLFARCGLLLASALGGALAALPALWLAERRKVPPVLSTVLLNMVAASLVTWLVRGPLRDPSGDYPQSRPLPDAVAFGPFSPGTRLTLAPILALLAALLLTAFLFLTTAGRRLRAVGLSPRAARAAGLPDVRVRAAAFLASGALAGLGGGLEVAAVTSRLYDPFSAGVGYTGIAAALLGGLHPLGALLASVLFAALGSGGSAMQREAGVPAALSLVVPALLVLALLTVRGPKEMEA